MRRETVRRRLYVSAVLLPLRRSDVESQETGYAASCGPGTEELANESAAEARSGVLGGNNQDEQECRGSSRRGSGPRDSATRIEPAWERRSHRRRGSPDRWLDRRTGPERLPRV